MMYERFAKSVWPMITALAVCVLTTGCQHLRLPAIDPSGNRIFLPQPNHTTFLTPSRSGRLIPGPAFTEAATPPPCVQPYTQPCEQSRGQVAVVPAGQPGLAVKVSGPQTAGIDSVVAYRVQVSNPGNAPVKNVVLSDERSAGLQVVASQPAGTPFGDRLEWRVSELPSNAITVIDVQCRAKEQGPQKYCITATAGELTSQSCQATQVAVPSIGLVMRGPDQIEIGQKAEFEVEVTNQGELPLENVWLIDEHGAGIKHESGKESPLKKQLDQPLQPGKTAYIKLIFNAVQAGTWSHTLTVTADGGHRAQANSQVTVTAPQIVARPAIQARITGPAKRIAGESAEYSMEVSNTGNVPLTNVQVYFTFAASLRPVKATGDHQWYQGGLIWRNRIRQLAPGKSSLIAARCLCLKADPDARVEVIVSCDQKVTEAADSRTQIDPEKAAVPPMQNGTKSSEPVVEPPVTGKLSLTVVDLNDSIQKGDETTYVITVKNDRNVDDANVVLNFQIPPGMEFVRLRHKLQGKRTFSPDGRSVDVGPINLLRAGETYPAFRLTLKGTRPGTFQFRVQAKSQRSPKGIVTVEDTTVVE